MANILVVGAGVVGTATGRGFDRHDHKVAFVDIDAEARRRVGALGFTATGPGEADLAGTDAVFVTVSTPTCENGIDLTGVLEASRTLGAALAHTAPDTFPVIVYRSTMPPGTTRRLVGVLETAAGARAGTDFGVAYSPEYLRAETALEDFLDPPLVTVAVAGDDGRTAGILRDLYRSFGRPMEFVGVEAAEFQKYVHNLFNAVKISFFNEMRDVAARLGISDAEKVFRITAATAEGLRDPRYGTACRGPYAGACLPKDTAAWLIEMERLGIDASLVTAARTVNVRLGGR
ncbi:UDP-glucose/GDP-mannose dehydrogenase family protein [Actinomadura rubrisoli]|uniref:UDP-glucose 6-dehydrogenase n=1 Tax=Actinomadura rubrisoli TaxID=2530368 RepID=A0A4R5C9C1_9ACTN|nr:UDP-glucose/GDP-mannose dehydrogenase family protein [Actinomadura rubrisoli]TDD96461.1 UDP-glucose/GDP-mannose dehydrogenase family protein [Actinomadura rubrisoli]